MPPVDAIIRATRILATALDDRIEQVDEDATSRRRTIWRTALRTSLQAVVIGVGRDDVTVEDLEAAWRPVAEPHAMPSPMMRAVLDEALPTCAAAWHDALPAATPEDAARCLAPALGLAERWHRSDATRRGGRRRKQRGAYFTPPTLVDALLDELAAIPAGAERPSATNAGHEQAVVAPSDPMRRPRTARVPLNDASPDHGQTTRDPTNDEPRLSDAPLRVCDPACGSGALLAAAARRQIGAGHQPRDVVARLYGVDLDPLAVELCRAVLLAIAHDAAASADAPTDGDDAQMSPTVTHDDVEALSVSSPGDGERAARRTDRRETARADNARAARRVDDRAVGSPVDDHAAESPVDDGDARRADDDRAQASAAAGESGKLSSDDRSHAVLSADDVLAATLRRHVRCGNALVGTPPPGAPPLAIAPPAGLAAQRLDWPDAFPDVLGPAVTDTAPNDAAPGFDLVIANPPWERIKVQARELLRSALPAAAASAHRAARRRAIARDAPELAALIADQRRAAKALSRWLRDCGAFPLSAHGDINTFALFTERAWQLCAPGGRVGLVVPSGLATDLGHRRLLHALLDAGAVHAFLDFENRARHFPDVDSRFRFALVALRRPRTGHAGATNDPGQHSPAKATDRVDGIPRAATLLHEPDERRDEERIWSLSRAQIRRCNPESGTVPMFRSASCARRGLHMHTAAPVLVPPDASDDDAYLWGVDMQRMFDMTNDSDLLRGRAELLEDGGGTLVDDARCGTAIETASGRYLPLVEGKLFRQHDGAAATFEDTGHGKRRRGRTRDLPLDERPRVAEPRFWVAADEVADRSRADDARFWLCLRALTNPTNQRTLVAALVPPGGVGNSALVLHAPRLASDPASRRRWLPLLCANLNALVLDDLTRQKMGNTNVNMYMVRQLPVLPPPAWEEPVVPGGPPLGALVAPRVLGLAACADALADLADGPVWDQPIAALRTHEERAHARAEIDALIAHRYGLDAADLLDILTPASPSFGFAALRRRELRDHGAFVTAQRLLDAFRTIDAWAG